MKQEKPLHARRQSEKSCERKKSERQRVVFIFDLGNKSCSRHTCVMGHISFEIMTMNRLSLSNLVTPRE